MTLYRQLMATMLALFAVLFIAAYFVQFNSTRDYLAQQLELSVTSTANSLGLALTPYLEAGDKVGAESVINAAFDGGFYRKFRLELLASQSVIQRENSATVAGVPEWFTNLGLFRSVQYESILTSGWLQLGNLQIEGNPGQAYYQLWQGMSRLLIAFVVTFLVVIALLIRALRYLLAPLEQIRNQAVAIEKHHFGQPIPLPKTLELRQVVQSINTLASKLAIQFKEQAEAAERMRERAFRDAVSGLGNRAYFMGQVNAWITESGRGASCWWPSTCWTIFTEMRVLRPATAWSRRWLPPCKRRYAITTGVLWRGFRLPNMRCYYRVLRCKSWLRSVS